MRDYRASRATAAKPVEDAPIRPPEEAPQAAQQVPSAAPRKAAQVVGGYRPRPGDEWVQRLSSRQQADILNRMNGGR